MPINKLDAFLALRGYELRLLDEDHYVDYFSCGRDEAMDNWLTETAWRWQNENLCKVWILAEAKSPNEPVGFFTLSATQIVPQILPKELRSDDRHNRPWVNNLLNPFPAHLLGKFALDKSFQNWNLGELLMLCAYVRHLSAAQTVGAKFLVLDVQHQKLAEYYRAHFGFESVPMPQNKSWRMVKSTRAIQTDVTAAFEAN